jgi:hypothetical protein
MGTPFMEVTVGVGLVTSAFPGKSMDTAHGDRVAAHGQDATGLVLLILLSMKVCSISSVQGHQRFQRPSPRNQETLTASTTTVALPPGMTGALQSERPSLPDRAESWQHLQNATKATPVGIRRRFSTRPMYSMRLHL